MNIRRVRAVLFSDLGILILLALVRLLMHALTNDYYGFHRDELATLDDARFIAWGYVAYPPLTPFIGRIALELLGPSTVGVRLFSGLAQAAALVLTGLCARELGGKRWSVLMAGLAVWVATTSFHQGTLFQYVSFDYLWWVLAAYCMVRLLKTHDPRWWLGVGAAVGLGMETKYTMAFFAIGIAGSVLLTDNRRYLKSPWLWGGVSLAAVIFLPNFIWQIRHDFISLQHLSAIHAWDVSIGRADNFLLDQFLLGANPFLFPLWLMGLYFFFFSRAGQPYRAIGWMYAIPLALFIAAQGRGYYLAPAYPMLLAGGAVWVEGRLSAMRSPWSNLVRFGGYGALVAGAAFIIALALPIAPVNSPLWDFASTANPDLKEELGWPELVEEVAQIYASLPDAERASTAIYTNNYGEAGAVNLYGPAFGLPPVLSGVNSYGLRGYPEPPPQTLIVVGYQREDLEPHFADCVIAGQVPNPYRIQNEEAKVPDIFVCRRLKQPWAEFWEQMRHFG